MPNPFIDAEAIDERLDLAQEEEEEEEEDVTDFIDKDAIQDFQQLQLLEDLPHHSCFNEWMKTLSSISEKYERSPSTFSSQVSSRPLSQYQHSPERDNLRAAVNQVPDSQLHMLLRNDDSSSFWKLKCQPKEQYSLLYDILSFKATSTPSGPPRKAPDAPIPFTPILLRSSTSVKSTGSDPCSHAWSAVANYVTSGQSIPQIQAELEAILGDKYHADDWHAAITSGTVEGDDDASVKAAEAAVYRLAAADGYPIAPVASNNAALNGGPPPASSSTSSTSTAVTVPIQAVPMPFPQLFSTNACTNDRAHTPLFLPDPSPTPSVIPLPSVEQMFLQTFVPPPIPPTPKIPLPDTASSDADLLSATFSLDAAPTIKHSAGPSSPNTGSNPLLTDHNIDPDDKNDMSSSNLPNSPIHAAFCVSHNIDCIYLETEPSFHPDAAKYSSITTYLHQHSAVRRLKYGHLDIKQIPPGDVADLLQWDCPTIQANTWIRVTKEGPYCSDVGLVTRRESSGGLRRLRVLLLSRPSPDAGQKRKPGRPPQALLHEPKDSPHPFTGKWQDTRDYKNGLIVLLLGDPQVTHKDVTFTDEAHFLFNKSGHLLLMRCPVPAPDSWVFELGEQVYSVQSDREKEGSIKSVEAQRCLVEYKDCLDDYIAKRNLRKKFRSTDSVEITWGDRKEEHGVIVAVWWETCEIALLREKAATELVVVHMNHCRRDHPRDGGGILWINERVTMCWGQYPGYTGVVKDIFPPRRPDQFTKLEVWIPTLTLSLQFNHDDMYQIITRKMLKDAVPLTPQQQHFRQPNWTNNTQSTIVVDPLTGLCVNVNAPLMQTPREPWINKSMKITRGPMKDYVGRVIGVN
ncbi:hypothetical protein VKT23_015226 [Stygiomarasmius scandens]|uniref:Uncharacterized protein n=1 Tax=Marasmiellus scandens TaxID=2682957 RepID=A0ABR1J2Y0_9AGAR